MDKDLAEVSIPQLESYYAQGRYTAVQVTQWHLDRIAKYNPAYNAFIKIFREQALARAAALDAARGPHGPLWGVPIAIKGGTSIAGEVTTVGWWGYTLPGKELRARANATVVDKLLAAGAVIIGHTNLPDLAATDTTIGSVGGRTGNAYNPIFSPGGSSGGSAVAVASSFVVTATGTDGGNSIRNPASNQSLVGVLSTEGLISNAGNHSGDWLRERTGPLTRSVTDAAIMLEVMAGEDPRDPLTEGSSAHRPASFLSFLKPGALKGKRFGVPKFILEGTPTTRPNARYWNYGTSPQTRAAFMRTLDELRAAGATIVIDDDILPESFSVITSRIRATRYLREGVDRFLKNYGPPAYSSTAEFEEVTGVSYPPDYPTDRFVLETDPDAEKQYFAPKREALAVYRETMRKFRLDGYVYPSLQVPSNPERVQLPSDYPSEGPYSATGWANKLGVPAIVVPAGFYRSGIPYGVEISGDYWDEGKLLGYAYDFEQGTHHRRPPELVTCCAMPLDRAAISASIVAPIKQDPTRP